jgi:hypothetical protein
MRITINLPDKLAMQAKKAAKKRKITLSEFIADAVRLALDRQRRSRLRFKVIAHGKRGVRPGVNLDDTSALLDRMDGLDDPDRSE